MKPDDHDIERGTPIASEPSSEPIAVLERWEISGGHWQVLSQSDAWITIGLLSCGGHEEMSRVTARTAELSAFLRGRTQSDQ